MEKDNLPESNFIETMMEMDLNRILNSTEEELERQEQNKKENKEEIRETQDIPLDKIVCRKVNEYQVDKVTEVAQSISEIGLIYPINVVANNDNGNITYVISAGETRYRAVKMLFDKAVKFNDLVNKKKYSTIRAYVLTSEQAKEGVEVKIHRATNDVSKNITLLQAIARYYTRGGKRDYFGDDDTNENRQHYIKSKYFNDYANPWKEYKEGKIEEPRWNGNTIAEDIGLRLTDSNSSFKSVLNILSILNKTCDEIDGLIIDGKVQKYEVEKIITVDTSKQKIIASKIAEGKTFEEATNGILTKTDEEKRKTKNNREAKLIAKKREEENNSNPVKILNSRTKSLAKLSNDLTEVLKGIEKNNLSPNMKAIYEQQQKIIKLINDLKDMPKDKK